MPQDEEVAAVELPSVSLPPLDQSRVPWMAAALVRAAVAAAWSVRHPREPFAIRPGAPPADRVYYRTEDGWEAPLWRHPPCPGGGGHPVLLAHGLGSGARSFDLLGEHSLAATLSRAGYDVWLLEHRGDHNALPPPSGGDFDFDDIVAFDVPAAIDAVRAATGAGRVLWIGHALGGLLLYGHLARGGGPDIAAATTLGAPVRFTAPRSHVRLATMASHLLPAGWRVPARAVQAMLASVGDAGLWGAFGRDVDGPVARGFMLHAGEDVPLGLVRQVARWVSTGALCDRGDRFDYVAGMTAAATPTQVVTATGDPVCPPAAARPAFDALDVHRREWLCLDEGWAHLDLLIGRRAADVLFPSVVDWLDRWKGDCWA